MTHRAYQDYAKIERIKEKLRTLAHEINVQMYVEGGELAVTLKHTYDAIEDELKHLSKYQEKL